MTVNKQRESPKQTDFHEHTSEHAPREIGTAMAQTTQLIRSMKRLTKFRLQLGQCVGKFSGNATFSHETIFVFARASEGLIVAL